MSELHIIMSEIAKRNKEKRERDTIEASLNTDIKDIKYIESLMLKEKDFKGLFIMRGDSINGLSIDTINIDMLVRKLSEKSLESIKRYFLAIGFSDFVWEWHKEINGRYSLYFIEIYL